MCARLLGEDFFHWEFFYKWDRGLAFCHLCRLGTYRFLYTHRPRNGINNRHKTLSKHCLLRRRNRAPQSVIQGAHSKYQYWVLYTSSSVTSRSTITASRICRISAPVLPCASRLSAIAVVIITKKVEVNCSSGECLYRGASHSSWLMLTLHLRRHTYPSNFQLDWMKKDWWID